MDAVARFRSKVAVMESGCHEWRSTLHRDGYGKFWFNGEQVAAHRVAYLLFVGEIAEGQWVLHHCDNRKCVNPGHLYLGDAERNAQDRSERMRYACRKVPPERIPLIRARYAAGGLSQKVLANEYGVHQTHISRIVRGAQRVLK